MTTLSPPPGFGAPRHLSPQPQQQSPPQPQGEKPKRSTNRRVSWANGENLFQIRLFVAEEAPAMSGSAQDQLQAKPTRNLHIFNPFVPAPPPDAPPGFGGVLVKSQADHVVAAAIVPQISWKPPSAVVLDPTWHVMAGGASLETALQKQREVRILEAVYPRPSSIPESPGEPVEAQEPYDDSSTPQIPLVPLEEEDNQDGSDPSNLSSGSRFPSLGPSGQGAGGVPAMGSSNGRQERMRQYGGNNLPVAMQEMPNARKDPAWGNGTAGSTARLVDHASNIMSGRPPPAAGPFPDQVQPNSKHTNGVVAQPDVAAAAAAAFAALSQSQQIGSMIDNELLIQILNDPSLIHSLQAKSPFAVPTNLKPKLSSHMTHNSGVSAGPADSMSLNRVRRAPESMNLNGLVLRGPDNMNLNGLAGGSDAMNLNGLSRGPDSMNLNNELSRGPENSSQGQQLLSGGVLGRANQWMTPPSTSYMTVPSGEMVRGQDGNSRPRSSDSYITAGERFPRNSQGPEERASTLPPPGTAAGNGQQLYTDPTNHGRGVVGLGQQQQQLPRGPSSNNGDAPPPGFSSGKSAAVNGVMPPNFTSKSPPSQLGGTQAGVAPPLGSASLRPLSHVDEQYFKSLIMQHGSANGGAADHGRTVADKGINGASRPPENIYNAQDGKRWFGREQQLDSGNAGRSERNGRDRQDTERPGAAVSGLEKPTPARAKSRKVCIYFGTARGCRNGDNCSFVHEVNEAEKRTDRTRSAPSSTPAPYAKRLKVDG